MAVQNSMFMFEVVVEAVKGLVDDKPLCVKAEFANVFSLDLVEPKQLSITMPEPLPMPPPKKGKKKKKKKRKPKPKKKKKGKKKKVPLPPPEPIIQSGQSILFASSPELLMADMDEFPLELSLWPKEKVSMNEFMGMKKVPWCKDYYDFLDKIIKCEKPEPVSVRRIYNIFEESTAKIIAEVTIEVKLRYFGDKIVTTFRTVPNGFGAPQNCKSLLYTGANSKITSFICRMKVKKKKLPKAEGEEDEDETEETSETSSVGPEIIATFKKDTPIPLADYKNAAPMNISLIDDGKYCCLGKDDKIPARDPSAPKTLPDINFLIDYVRKVITTCSENLRMLTPRQTIRPRIKATDLDRICLCARDDWPEGPLAERMKKEKHVCALCGYLQVSSEDDNTYGGAGAAGTSGGVGLSPNSFDIRNLRGPCGRTDCKLAVKLRDYILQLLEEDNKEINLEDIIGPCGSRACDVALKIQEFIRREGVFEEGGGKCGLSTICGCQDLFQKSLQKHKPICDEACLADCADCDEAQPDCCGCDKTGEERVYCINYFTVHYDIETDSKPSSGPSKASSGPSKASSGPSKASSGASKASSAPSKAPSATSTSYFPFCREECPTKEEYESKFICSKDECVVDVEKLGVIQCDKGEECGKVCETLSPNDSDVVIRLDDIKSPCCVKTCDAADKVKEFLVEGALYKMPPTDDPCYCDCDCKFTFGRKTTYCPICGGYEMAGDDYEDMPPGIKPQPCPIYHKTYDKNKLKVIPALEPETEAEKKILKKCDEGSVASKPHVSDDDLNKPKKGKGKRKGKGKGKGAGKGKSKGARGKKKQPNMQLVKDLKMKTGVVGIKPKIGKKKKCWKRIKLVDAKMGWAWKAKNVPGLKFRPEWKPGAAVKNVVKRLRAHGRMDELSKKKKKKIVKKPEIPFLIKIAKEDREYSVTLQNMKPYSKQRRPNQYPFEKTPQSFFVGRTEAHNAARYRKEERRQRRKERAQRAYIQQSFRNMCEEICLKTYKQAVGIMGNENNPDCPCFPEVPDHIYVNADSCSCSESPTTEESDTDNDEWEVHFSPPIAKYDPNFNIPLVVTADKFTQYSYLDYRVKCMDTTGNQIARQIYLPCGRAVCTDLGGFWGPEKKKWYIINEDGWVGPDQRWHPKKFIGPDGEDIEPENGKFQIGNKNLVCGVDGYVDCNEKWVFYDGKSPESIVSVKPLKKGQGAGDTSWSCFGDATPIQLAHKGIVGHGTDKQLLVQRLTELKSKGANISIPTTPEVPRAPRSKSSKKSSKAGSTTTTRVKRRKFTFKCKHAKPSPKGVLACDDLGNKVYFTIYDTPNKRNAERVKNLTDQGIGVSAFHVPCFSSFISCETMKKEMRDRLLMQNMLNTKPQTLNKEASHLAT